MTIRPLTYGQDIPVATKSAALRPLWVVLCLVGFLATAVAQEQVAVFVSPVIASVTANTTQQFTATVTGASDTSVTWDVDGIPGGSPVAGTITTDGLYTAPASAGSHTVTATSVADPTKSASAAVTVTVVSVSISPTSATVTANATQQFTATVTGSGDTSVTWYVDGVLGGDSTTGTITTGGLYTAPASAGSHTVTAKANADPAQSASAAVTVTVVSVSISPTSASVTANATQQFTATVTGASDTSVTWYVDGVLGGDSTTGTITTGGLYTAPASAGSHTVTAKANADPAQSASAAVTVTVVSVSISPTSATVTANATQQFTATVTGASDTSVTWYVDGVLGGDSTTGTITAGGLYTAPASAGSHTVTAKANADPVQSASAAVTVTVVSVSISPTSASVTANATQQFTATVTGSANTDVQWSVDGANGGNATVGTISTTGLYTAPASAGSHTVTATSVADPTKSASAAVTVTVVSVSISPTSASVTANATQQFTATVTGAGDTSVTWYVDGVLGGDSTTGTITAGGLYTAPASAGSHTVTAKANADPAQSASAAVTVTVVSVSISPTSASVTANATQHFTATVTGSGDSSVTWYVDGVLGGDSTTGTITTGGLYTAPASAGSHTVTAKANADPAQSASAAVTVTVVSVSISPTSATVTANATQQFTATVTGASDTSVTWYVDGVLGGDSTTGTITAGGLYTAPASAGSHTVTAKANADPVQSASAAVTVTVVSVSISPTSASVTANATQQFTATVTGSANTDVQWSVDGANGGNATVGTISTTGLYTAPASAGSHTVTATSVADPTKSASATVTVTAAIVSVSISPTPITVTVNTTKQFTATVTGTTNTDVQWSVDGLSGGNSTVGTISTSGLYTAPASAGTHTVTATSVADPTKSASAAVKITTISISISPTTVNVTANTTKQFAATVTGTTNTGVKWYVDGVLGGTSASGTITTGGLYTAPSSAGSHTVTITSNAEPNLSASSAVTVTVVAVSISPTSVTLSQGATKQFAATVTGTTNTGVKWYVDGVLGGTSASGTITTGGLYTAPASAGSHTVMITSNADPTKSASSAVTVSDVAISISPTSFTLSQSSTKQFTATVTGTTNTGVTWSVDGVLGGSSSTGTITTSGLYTAPATAGSHTVTVTSNADATKSASAAVTVAGVAISISPTSVSVSVNTTKQFTATVTGTTNTGVQWYVDGVLGGASSTGTITTNGLYTAPATAGSHSVTVTSNADPTQSANAAVTVSDVAISISPTTASVTVNTTKQFTATVTGTTNTGVQWYVDGVLGGASSTGTITTGGLYTAPATTGPHTVTATSNADPTQSANAAVTVTSIAVSISPTSVTLLANATKQFAATVTGTTNTGVKWYVDGVQGGSSSTGTITTGGLYTAPATAGSHTVTVTSNADPNLSASAAVTVTLISVSISPTSATVTAYATRQFTATVTGSTAGVTWYVDGVLGGSTAAGTITTGGLYTAPATAGSHTVTATAVDAPSPSASAAVTVTAAPNVTITISPTTATVVGTQTKQFVSTVTGSTNTGVKWYVDGILQGNDTAGEITTAGMYLAPNLSGTHTVTITSNANPSKSASATVTVTGNIWVQVMPYDACPAYGGTQQYTATVAGTTNQGVTWQVDGVNGGNSTVGTISTAGLYAAPSSSGSHSIRAVSKANTSKVQTVTVSVSNTISASVIPTSIQVPAGQTVPFSARVCSTSNTGVTWYVDNIAGGNSTVGTITSAGNYTAPANPGTHTVKAVSVANTSKSGTATVTVSSGVVADFGNRSAGVYTIPPAMMGNNLTNLTDPNGMALLTKGGMIHTRLYSRIQEIFTSQTNANWTKIDPILTSLRNAGITPMLQITYTPSFLVPVVSGCTQSFKMPPTNYAAYANLAAQIVAHVNQNFPGLVTDYEIWNEPDLSSFCVNPNTDAQRKSVYLSLYAAVAQAMKAQAAIDGRPIRLGGPTTVGSTSWVSSLVSDSRTAPYVDFVSYHQYPTGNTNIQAGMTWDTPHGPQTLYSITQGSSGFATWFTNVAKATHAGQQPNAANTPVYVSEWNDNWAFMKDCCRNDPTYSPVLNGLMILDFMNTVYAGSGAVPGKLFYYSASAFPYFCMIGVWDTTMSCQYPSGSTPVPYPSYQPYNLMSSLDYLGLLNGGTMAVSVSPGTTQNGLAATAFYTASRDVIFIVNPTPTNYSGVNVAFNNAGISNAQGTSYRINGPGNTIVTAPVTLTAAGNGYNASVTIPPYSVVAVAIQ
jgi:glycosyl hydrolase family 39 (putative alpha-L-iduronidase)